MNINMKNKILGLVLTVFISLLSVKSAQALLQDSAKLVLGLSTASFEIQDFLLLIENKPIISSDMLPGEWSEYGKLKVTNDLEPNSDYYMYVSHTDGNICSEIIISLEVAENEQSDWIEVYRGDIEEIRGNNDRVLLNVDELDTNSILVRQRIQFKESANKNKAGKQCLWNEVFRLQGSTKETYKEHVLTRNIMSAGYWIPPSVEIKEPKSNKSYELGSLINIKWKSKSHTHDKNEDIEIKLDLYEASGENIVQTIAHDLDNTGSYKWALPNDLPEGDYKIKIEAVDGESLSNAAFSDTFTITLED